MKPLFFWVLLSPQSSVLSRFLILLAQRAGHSAFCFSGRLCSSVCAMPSEEPKHVKKEEIDEGHQEKKPTVVGSKKPLSSTGKSKATNANAYSSQAKGSKVKKEEPQCDESPKPTKSSASTSKVKKEEEDDMPISKKISSVKIDKDAKKPKKEEVINRKGGIGAEQKQREKKVYELPGQKRDPPDERDPLRIFYETLYKQIPKSEMAQIWMMECGLLSEDIALIVYETKQKSKQSLRSPSKSAATVKSSSKSVTVKKTTSSTAPANKKATPSSVATKHANQRKAQGKISEDDSDDDFTLSAKSKQSNKRKAQDKISEDGSEDDFVLSTKAKKRKV